MTAGLRQRFATTLALVALAAATGCGGQDEAPAAGNAASPVSGRTAAIDASVSPPLVKTEPFPESYQDFPQRPANTLTFTRDVAPLIYEHCGECHRPGGPAPFALLTYEQVSKRSTEIATVTKQRYMPPWLPDRGYVDLVGERGLTVDQVGIFQQWILEGGAEGDPAHLPPMPDWPDGWEMGPPDLVVSFPEPYTLRAEPPDVFRNFVIPALVDGDRYVRGYQFRPDVPEVVHHATIEVDRTRESRRRDQQDPGPGFYGMQPEAANPPDGHFVGWVPGRRPTMTPETMAWRLGKDTDLVVQLHMLPSGKPERVSPELGLYFTDRPPTEVPQMIRLGSRALDIPAGEPAYVATDSYTLPVDVKLMAVLPHAHYLCQVMEGWATLPDGGKQWLIRVRDWDFNWQDEYRYVESLHLPKGTVLSMRYTFDNSTGNIQNPHDPPVRVRFGPSTYDEMGDLWFQALAGSPRDAELLKADYARFNLERGIATYRARIAQDPDDHENYGRLGNRLMDVGQIREAILSYRKALEMEPADVHIRRNLATALFYAGAREESIQQFNQVLSLDPGDVEGHASLGFFLATTGRVHDGIRHLRRAIELREDNPQARFHLARALEISGQPVEALAQYRKTAEQEPSWSPPLNAAAWLAATDSAVRDPAAAVRFAERAVELTEREDPLALEALGVAYGAAARFDEAIEAAEAALALIPPNAPPDHRRRLQDELRHYRDGRPYAPRRR